MQIRLLREEDLAAVFALYAETFTPYVDRYSAARAEFDDMVARRGIDFGLSAGAFLGGELAAFVLTGRGTWLGQPTAYEIGSSAAPAYRGQGFTLDLYWFLEPRIVQAGLGQRLVEVLSINRTAVQVYQDMGYRMTRRLISHRRPPGWARPPTGPPAGVAVHSPVAPVPPGASEWWDIHPAWQNDTPAIRQARFRPVVLTAVAESDRLIGYGVVFPATGDVAQLAVDPEWRRRGVGRALLAELAVRVPADRGLQCLNMEPEPAMDAFLAAEGFHSWLTQLEFTRGDEGDSS